MSGHYDYLDGVPEPKAPRYPRGTQSASTGGEYVPNSVLFPICVVDGCEERVSNRTKLAGVCWVHYMRKQQRGAFEVKPYQRYADITDDARRTVIAGYRKMESLSSLARQSGLSIAAVKRLIADHKAAS